MKLEDKKLAASLQRAYSAERAAALAYVGHARSLSDEDEIRAVRKIEGDEWEHRREVLAIMRLYEIPVSRWLETRYLVIGKLIGLSCLVIGRFMPYFFAGKLESGNVCEYFVMLHRFHALGVTEHDEVLYEMGIKEKEHEVHFLNLIREARWLPWFERIFGWGSGHTLNDVDLASPPGVGAADHVCRRTPDAEEAS